MHDQRTQATQLHRIIDGLTAIHLLSELAAGEKASEQLISDVWGFYKLLGQQHYWLHLLPSVYARRFAPGTLDDASLRALTYLPDDLRYNFGVLMAFVHTRKGDLPAALRYSSHCLVDQRTRDKNEPRTIAKANLYDESPLHQYGAAELCSFALLGDMGRLDFGSLRILDIGCGTGLNTDFMVRYASYIAGLDLDDHALLQSGRRKRYDDFLAGDASITMAQLEGHFDLIICTGAIYFFSDLNWLFAQLRRLLSPTGQFVTNAFQADDKVDIRVTRAGNYRYCHSLEYLRRIAGVHGIQLVDVIGSIAYRLPSWLLRFQPAST